MSANDIAYFAYGSLVNRQTRLTGTQAIPYQITGWIRQWSHCVTTPYGKLCALTVENSPTAQIDGVLVFDKSEHLVDLDHREIGYKRQQIEVKSSDLPEHLGGVTAYIYVSNQEPSQCGSIEFPIWRSYLDCVLAGYLEVWGYDGVARFIATTNGWETPILEDRGSPKYPRAVCLDEQTRQVIDGLLEDKGIYRKG